MSDSFNRSELDSHIVHQPDDSHIVHQPDDSHIVQQPDDSHIVQQPDESHILHQPDGNLLQIETTGQHEKLILSKMVNSILAESLRSTPPTVDNNKEDNTGTEKSDNTRTNNDKTTISTINIDTTSTTTRQTHTVSTPDTQNTAIIPELVSNYKTLMAELSDTISEMCSFRLCE